jgi:hypothetical protein
VLDIAHQRRMDLIMEPTPLLRRTYLSTSYPHSGTILGDRFFGDGQDAGRGGRSGRRGPQPNEESYF